MLRTCFEIREKDLLGRLGILKTKSGNLETPYLFPVINPSFQPVPPSEIQQLGFNGIITNAYLIWKRSSNQEPPQDVHKLTGFNGVVATDSGGYQILQYGDIEVAPDAIVRFQEKINTDVGVILDIPTGANPDRRFATRSVRETLQRAVEATRIFTRDDILWEAPVQGGIHLDLVEYSARRMARLSYPIYALGSPTPSMEQYSFDYLIDMIVTAREFIPSNKPLHLFGAGHPMMLSLAVAMGCDLFDSAAYALFARSDRYLTSYGTFKLKDLAYFPCSCPTCSSATPDSVRKRDSLDREAFLARHNLHVTNQEIRTIKQAIVDGRLWELAAARSRSHPALHEAFQQVTKYADRFEDHTPSTKKRGIFVAEPADLFRPEIVRHKRKLLTNFRKPRKTQTLLMVPASASKRRSRWLTRLTAFAARNELMHTCLYGKPYELIPEEMAESYPLAQTQTSGAIARGSVDLAVMGRYLRTNKYRRVILVHQDRADEALVQGMKRLSRQLKFKLRIINIAHARSRKIALTSLN